MADFYDRASTTASRLLTKFNQAEYILSRAGIVIPAQNEWDEPTQLPPQTWTLYGTSDAVEAKYVDGDVVTASARQLMFAAFDDVIKTGDVLTVNGKVQTVLKIMPVTERNVAWVVFVVG
ncbi:MAG: hypothetical protein QM647_15110 [Asticcacaulis sp.]|uniref:hypothetical protein n=1 Tax=Asticcacaulis sp. TaxID=1872648 RepID=UPI0039E4FD5F